MIYLLAVKYIVDFYIKFCIFEINNKNSSYEEKSASV